MKTLCKTDIDLIVYDFDGVMTNNRLYMGDDGKEAVVCNRADGLGVDIIREMGIRQVIISTESNPVVSMRAKKLKLEVMQNAGDKLQILRDFCDRNKIQMKRVLYIGNDINDLAAMKEVGFSVCPSDSHAKIRDMAQIITKACGGEGVIRELAGDILTNGASIPETKCIGASDPAPKSAVEDIRKQFDDSAILRISIRDDAAIVNRIAEMAHAIADCLKKGGKVFFAGNGGSFADAQHLAAEFVGRFMIDRDPFPGICLGANSSSMSAIGNDYSFDDVFVRELRALGRGGDIFIAISTSGNSGNLITAIKTAEELGLKSYALLGKGGGKTAELVPSIVIPSSHTARIQELHITIGHMICGLVDSLLIGQKN